MGWDGVEEVGAWGNKRKIRDANTENIQQNAYLL